MDWQKWLDKEIEKIKKQQEQAKKEMELAYMKKKAKESEILSLLPKCEFEPCSICGNKPELDVDLDKTSFRVDIRCHKCDWGNGCYLNSYEIDKIPKEPLMANPKYTWMDHWNTVNKWAKEEYDRFNSDNWKYTCAKCGKKRRGYDIDMFDILDGKYYCKECHENAPYVEHVRDSNNILYRSFEEILKANGGTKDDYVRICE